MDCRGVFGRIVHSLFFWVNPTESGDTRNTTPIMSASSPTKTVDEKAEVPDSTTTAASISAITGDVTLNVKNIGVSKFAIYLLT